MKTIKLNLGTRSYDIIIGSGAVKRIPAVVKSLKFRGPIVVITDKIVNEKTKKLMKGVLSKLPNDHYKIIVPSGERSKALSVYQDVIQKVSKKTKTHKPMIIALGGGVVGDLGGFVAASYRRGVPYIQVPTTLLAQVDSSVGGKVGVDLPAAKNLVGAFWQPKAVIVDTDMLKTLPRRQVQNGIGEVIKYAVIKSPGLFVYLEKNMKALLGLKKEVVEKVIHECLKIKARVVEKDEHDDRDTRIILNFGHTLGHAIEAASGYSNLCNHGESVALGMLAVGEIAMQLEMFKEKDQDRMKALIKKAGLPVRVEGVSIKQVMDSHKYDKKFTSGTNRFLLPKKIGGIDVVEDIPGILIRAALKKYVG